MQSDDADNANQTMKRPARTRRTGEAKYKSRSLPTSITSTGADDRSVNTTSSGTSLIRLYRAGSGANKGGRRPKSLRSVSEDLGGNGSESASLSMLLNSAANFKRTSQHPKQQEQHSTKPHPHQQQKQQDPHPSDQHQLHQICRHSKYQKQRVGNDSGGSSDNNHFSSSSSSCPSCGSSSVEDNAAAQNKKNEKASSAVQASACPIRQLSPVSETGGVLHHDKNHGPIKSPSKGSKNKMRKSTSGNRINEKNPNNLTRRLNTINAVMATMGAADLDNQSISSMPSLASYNSESHRSMPSLASFNSESMRSRKSTSMMSTTSSYSMDTPSDDSFSSLVTNDSSICSFSQYSVFSSKSNAPKNNSAGGSTAAAAAAAAGGGGASSPSSTAKSNVASAASASSSAAAVKGGTNINNNNNNNAVLVNKSNSYSSSGSSVSSSNNSRIMTRFVGGIRARNVSVPVPSNADVVAGKTLDYIESAPVKQPKKEEEQEKRKLRWGGTKNKVDAVPIAIVRKVSQHSPITRSKSDSNYHHEFSLTRKDVSRRDLVPQLARRRSSKEYYEALQQHQQRDPKRDVLPQLARRRSSKEYEEQQQASSPPPPRSRDVLPNIVRRRGSLDDHDVVRDDIETMIQKINI